MALTSHVWPRYPRQGPTRRPALPAAAPPTAPSAATTAQAVACLATAGQAAGAQKGDGRREALRSRRVLPENERACLCAVYQPTVFRFQARRNEIRKAWSSCLPSAAPAACPFKSSRYLGAASALATTGRGMRRARGKEMMQRLFDRVASRPENEKAVLCDVPWSFGFRRDKTRSGKHAVLVSLLRLLRLPRKQPLPHHHPRHHEYAAGAQKGRPRPSGASTRPQTSSRAPPLLVR